MVFSRSGRVLPFRGQQPRGRSRRRRGTARGLPVLAWLAALAAGFAPLSLSAQYRVGLVLGGTSAWGVLVEYRWERQGLEVQAGTWSFRDLSLSVTAKQYVGSNAFEPYVGAGLWGIVARAEEGTGYGLIARLPVGLDWEFVTRHSAGFAIHFNRALALNRPDPADQRPPRAAFIPLPEISYRWLAQER